MYYLFMSKHVRIAFRSEHAKIIARAKVFSPAFDRTRTRIFSRTSDAFTTAVSYSRRLLSASHVREESEVSRADSRVSRRGECVKE